MTQIRQQRSSRIPAGYSAARLPLFDAFPRVSRGYFRVVMQFVWFVAGTNTELGSTVIVPHQVADHRCATTTRPCVPYDGFVRLGTW